MTEDEELSRQLKALVWRYRFWWPIPICVILWAVIGYVVPSLLSKDRSAAGQFGDMFGAANALFSGLAFLGVAYTLYQQNQESRRTSRKHNEQITLQQVALERAEMAHTEQLELATKAASIQALSTLADLHFQMMLARPDEKAIWLDKADEYADRAAFLTGLLDSEFEYRPVTFSVVKAAGARLQEICRTVNLDLTGICDEAVDSRQVSLALRSIQTSYGQWLVDRQAFLPNLTFKAAKELFAEIQSYTAECSHIILRPSENASDEETKSWKRIWHMPENIRQFLQRLTVEIYSYQRNVERRTPRREPQ